MKVNNGFGWQVPIFADEIGKSNSRYRKLINQLISQINIDIIFRKYDLPILLILFTDIAAFIF